MSHNQNYRQFTNPYGHFSEDGFEYIVTRPDTPRPWTNVISNGDFGLVISQAGGGFSWRTHTSLNRLTRWSQDLIRDEWGKWLYLRDLETGGFYSLAYQPVQAPFEKYQVRHGLGYSVFEQQFQELATEWTLLAATEKPIEIWICKIKNLTAKTKKFQLTSYFEWNLGAAPDVHREFHKLFIETKFHSRLNAISATKTLWEVPTSRGHWNTEWPYIGFHAVDSEVSGWDTSKDKLIGRNGRFYQPTGILKGSFTKTDGRFEDAVASLATDMTLAPYAEKTVIFVLGQIDRTDPSAREQPIAPFIQEFCNEPAAVAELQKVKTYWKNLIDKISIETPDPSLDLLTNIWLKYQVISGHLSARTGYYQQSGAYGFRDQLQSQQVWLPIDPSKMREHIGLNARHQFQKGTVLHWWHPLTEQGLPTDMTDDLLWLPFMLNRYLLEVGDYSYLKEIIPFYDGGEATLQEHCIRAIDVVLNRFSPRGIPLMGAGDWCDGFSAVGLDWKGESFWLGMFLYDILVKWSEILIQYSPQANPELAKNYLHRAEQLKNALNTHGWNGQWYLAATKDDGTPIGDPSQPECKIYLNSQTWAIMTGIADAERQEQIADAILRHLEGDNGFMLFHPAFKTSDNFIGYITRYAPGLRENGGVYTHAATWGVLALAKLGRAEDAFRILSKLNPVLQTQEKVERYVCEPYVLPGNIDGKDSKYYGRAGWSWYTGSAGWLFSIVHEAICGVQPVHDGLKIEPCIPSDWPELKMKRTFRGATFHITIENPNSLTGGVREIRLNGQTISGNVIPPQKPGNYEVRVKLEKI
jgi:cellobiose phosphorylase